jgi:hypothetical protein
VTYAWCVAYDRPVDEAAWHEEFDAAWASWEAIDPEITGEYDCSEDAFAIRVANGDSSSESEDLVFGADIAWGMADEVSDPSCVDLFSVQTVTAHAIGHHLGLGHTCDAGEVCTGAETQAAVMYWAIPSCEVRVPNGADEALLHPDDEEDPGTDPRTGAPADSSTEPSGCDGRAWLWAMWLPLRRSRAQR